MKIHLFLTLLILIILTSIVAFTQSINATETVEPTVQTIGNRLRDMSPLLLIGLGILLIFIQKFAKLAGIILLIVGLVRLSFMFL